MSFRVTFLVFLTLSQLSLCLVPGVKQLDAYTVWNAIGGGSLYSAGGGMDIVSASEWFDTINELYFKKGYLPTIVTDLDAYLSYLGNSSSVLCGIGMVFNPILAVNVSAECNAIDYCFDLLKKTTDTQCKALLANEPGGTYIYAFFLSAIAASRGSVLPLLDADSEGRANPSPMTTITISAGTPLLPLSICGVQRNIPNLNGLVIPHYGLEYYEDEKGPLYSVQIVTSVLESSIVTIPSDFGRVVIASPPIPLSSYDDWSFPGSISRSLEVQSLLDTNPFNVNTIIQYHKGSCVVGGGKSILIGRRSWSVGIQQATLTYWLLPNNKSLVIYGLNEHIFVTLIDIVVPPESCVPSMCSGNDSDIPVSFDFSTRQVLMGPDILTVIGLNGELPTDGQLSEFCCKEFYLVVIPIKEMWEDTCCSVGTKCFTVQTRAWEEVVMQLGIKAQYKTPDIC